MTEFEVKPNWRRSTAIALTATTAVLALFLSPLRQLTEDDFSRRLEYQARSNLGRSPQLDPRIKMIAFEDYTASVVQRPDLNLLEWATVFEHLAAGKPRVIFIDRIFGLPIGTRPGGGVTDDEAAEFVRRMKHLGVPVVAGAFFQESPIARRAELTTDRLEFQFTGPHETDKQRTYPSWLQVEKGHLYGPHPAIADGFALIGGINYEGNGYIRPLQRIAEDKVLPHSALLVAGSPELRGTELFVDKVHLPVAKDGRLTINLSDRETYYERTKNLLSFILRINKGEASDWIAPGDIVAILPMMYTGNTDMKDVPIGRLQGSYINISAINNALSGDWITEVPAPALWIIAAGLAGVLIGNLATISSFVIATLLLVSAQVASGLLLFSYASMVFPWLFSGGAFAISATAVFAERARRIDAERKRAAAKAEEGVRVRKLLHVVCHDIANPLMVVSARLSMMGGDPGKVGHKPSERQAASNADKAAYAAERIRTIIDAVRNLEAVEMGKVDVVLEPVSLRELFQSVHVSFEDALNRKEVRLETKIDDEQDLVVLADRTSFENFVLNNLISNAIKFSQRGGLITLSASQTRDHIEVVVKDQGIGIPKELLEDIFSPTKVTTRSGTEDEAGTGFGMPIVKSYIERYGGDIIITSTSIDENEKQHGTSITMLLKSHSSPATD